MTDSTLNRFLSQGTNSQRLAFTPSPPTPASGPASSYLWFETDTSTLWCYDVGTSTWTEVSGGGGGGGGGGVVYVPPSTATFSWTNQPSGATQTNLPNGRGLQVFTPSAGGGRNMALLTEAAPATPWTRWLRLSALPNWSNYYEFGIAVADGSGKIIHWDLNTNNAYCFNIEEYTNPTTYGSSVYGPSAGQGVFWPPYVGVQDDGTNLNFLVSYDGVSSYVVYSASRTAFFSAGPTLVGIGVNGFSQTVTMNAIHWDSNLPLFQNANVCIDPYGPPSSGGWTTFSGDSTNPTLNSVSNLGLVIDMGPNNLTGNLIRGVVQAVPGSTYTFSARIRGNRTPYSYRGTGICVSDGTKYIMLAMVSHTNGAPHIQLGQFTNTTTLNTSPVDVAADEFEYFQIQNNGTNRIYSLSRDGTNWTPIYSESHTAFLTETELGFVGQIDGNDNTYIFGEHTYLTVPWMKATSP